MCDTTSNDWNQLHISLLLFLKTDFTIIKNKADTSATVPAIKAAPIRMEARLHQYVPIANHEGQIITDLFIVEITDFYFDSAVFDEEHQYILPEKLQPIARLAGNDYTTLGEIREVRRPT